MAKLSQAIARYDMMWTSIPQVLERDGKLSELDERTDALQVDYHYQLQSPFFDCHDLCLKNCNLQKGADQFKNNATKLERKKRCQPPISCHIDNFKLCSFIRWENWKLTVTIGVVVVVLVIVIIVLAVVFAPSSPVWHVESAIISLFCLLYDPGVLFFLGCMFYCLSSQ